VQFRAREAMDSRRIAGRKRQRRWSSAAHRSSDAFEDETDIGDVAPHCRSRPALASDNLKNLFASQTIRCLHVPDRLHSVSSSSKHAAESAGRNIADPVGDAAVCGAFGGQRLHRSGRHVKKQTFCDH
jgi:hypothetical protein